MAKVRSVPSNSKASRPQKVTSGQQETQTPNLNLDQPPSAPPGQLIVRHPTAHHQEGILAFQRMVGNRETSRLLTTAHSKHRGGTYQLAQREATSVSSPLVSRQALSLPQAPVKDLATAAQQPLPLSSIEERFPLDVDEDGDAEEKRLFFQGTGAQAELMINPDPAPFDKFLQKPKYLVLRNNPTVSKYAQQISAQLKQPLTVSQGQVMRNLLQNLATTIQNIFLADPNFQAQRAQFAKLEKPPSQIKTDPPRTLSFGGMTEVVSDGVTAEPLSIRSGGTTGTIPQGTTPFMQALRQQAPYVRGHMLNAKVHGPGLDWNLVPISSTFNKVMERDIETPLKEIVLGKNRVVSFSIKPQNWGGYAKGNSPIENLLPKSFIVNLASMKVINPAHSASNPANWQVKKYYIHNKIFTHDAPKTRNTNSSGTPVELDPGVYLPISGEYDLVPGSPGIWEVWGAWQKQPLTGILFHREPTKINFGDAPTRVKAKSGATPLEDTGGGLLASDDTLARKELVHRINQIDEKVKLAQTQAGQVETSFREMLAYAQYAQRQANRLDGERSAKLPEHVAQLQTRVGELPWLANEIQLDEAGSLFWQNQFALLSTNPAQFWQTNELTNRQTQADAENEHRQSYQSWLSHARGELADTDTRDDKENLKKFEKSLRFSLGASPREMLHTHAVQHIHKAAQNYKLDETELQKQADALWQSVIGEIDQANPEDIPAWQEVLETDIDRAAQKLKSSPAVPPT